MKASSVPLHPHHLWARIPIISRSSLIISLVIHTKPRIQCSLLLYHRHPAVPLLSVSPGIYHSATSLSTEFSAGSPNNSHRYLNLLPRIPMHEERTNRVWLLSYSGPRSSQFAVSTRLRWRETPIHPQPGILLHPQTLASLIITRFYLPQHRRVEPLSTLGTPSTHGRPLLPRLRQRQFQQPARISARPSPFSHDSSSGRLSRILPIPGWRGMSFHETSLSNYLNIIQNSFPWVLRYFFAAAILSG